VRHNDTKETVNDKNDRKNYQPTPTKAISMAVFVITFLMGGSGHSSYYDEHYSDSSYSDTAKATYIRPRLGTRSGTRINCIFGYGGSKPLCYSHNCRHTV